MSSKMPRVVRITAYDNVALNSRNVPEPEVTWGSCQRNENNYRTKIGVFDPTKENTQFSSTSFSLGQNFVTSLPKQIVGHLLVKKRLRFGLAV